MTATALTVTPRTAPVSAGRAAGDRRLINSSLTAGRVWLGTSSGVSTLTGIPLEAGASLTWTDEAELWLIADPAAAGPVSVIVSDSVIDDWNPSPAALAALVASQTAAQLLATGVPNVLLEQTLYSGTLAAGAIVFVDVSSAASVIITAAQVTSTSSLKITQQAPGGTTVDEELVPYIDLRGVSGRLALVGTTLKITNTGANPEPLNLVIVGSNRAAEHRWDVRQRQANGDAWTLAQTTMTAATRYTLAANDPAAKLQGLAFASFNSGGGATAKGRFLCVSPDGTETVLCDSSEMVTASIVATGGFYQSKLIALPPSAYTIKFYCGTAGVYQPTCQFVPATL